jgi:sporulation protein YlmC with PRC-barrel domain
MSKGTSHYNWQNWISQTNLQKNKKIKLNEMQQEWIDLIMPAIVAASKKTNNNFKYFFGNEGNRIVIPYDQVKMTKLGLLMSYCINLMVKQNEKDAENYTREMFAKYADPNWPDMDPYSEPYHNKAPILQKMPEFLTIRQFGDLILRVPQVKDVTINIREKTVKQKYVPAGGGAPQEKEVMLYEPVLEFYTLIPFSEKTPKEVIEKAIKFTGTPVNTKTNSFTIGQILQRFKETELFDWWQNNQSKFTQDRETVDGAKEVTDNDKNTRYCRLEVAKEKFNDAREEGASEYSIVISRSPIDVLRMSDFRGFTSCHSQPEQYGGGSYFYCALAEARNQGAIAYLVKTEDLEQVDLNAPEIFMDSQRGISGIVPLQRVRLRRIIDQETDVDFMAIEDRVYGTTSKVSFIDTIKKWVVEKTSKMLVNDPGAAVDEGKYYVPSGDSMGMLGGSYTDTGTSYLARDIASTLFSAVKFLPKDDQSYVRNMVDEYEVSIKRKDLEWIGEEDESETTNECDEAKLILDERTNTFDQRADFASVSHAEVVCQGDRILDSIVTVTQFSTEISQRDTGVAFADQVDLGYFFTNDQKINALKETLEKRMQNILSSYGPIFNGSEIVADVQLFSGPMVNVRFEIRTESPGIYEFESFLNEARKTLNKIDYVDEIQGLAISQLISLGLVRNPVTKETQVQDLIQKFSEELGPKGNHFQWYDQKSDEDKGIDAFILVGNPARVPHPSNYPIIAKVPIVSGDNSFDVVNMFGKIVNDVNDISRTARAEMLETLFAQFNGIESTASFGKQKEKEHPVRTRTVDIPPIVEESYELKLLVPTADEELAKKPGSDFLNVRAQFIISLNTSYRTEQEVINALNFIEKLGTEENYQKVIEIFNGVFKKKFKEIDPSYSQWFQDDKRKFISNIEKAASSPISQETIPSDQIKGLKQGSLFTGEPLVKDQYLNENKPKKLVINERFKRLLRNIKK